MKNITSLLIILCCTALLDACAKSHTCVCTDTSGKELYRSTNKYNKESDKKKFEDDCAAQDKISGQNCSITS